MKRLRQRVVVGAVGGLLTYCTVRFATGVLVQWLMTRPLGDTATDGELGVEIGPVIIGTSLSIAAASAIYGLLIPLADDLMRPSESLVACWVFWVVITFLLTWVGLLAYVFAFRWLPEIGY